MSLLSQESMAAEDQEGGAGESGVAVDVLGLEFAPAAIVVADEPHGYFGGFLGLRMGIISWESVTWTVLTVGGGLGGRPVDGVFGYAATEAAFRIDLRDDQGSMQLGLGLGGGTAVFGNGSGEIDAAGTGLVATPSVRYRRQLGEHAFAGVVLRWVIIPIHDDPIAVGMLAIELGWTWSRRR